MSNQPIHAKTKSDIDSAVEARLKEFALVPKKDRDMSVSIYKQVCLFEELGLPRHYMFTNRIVFDDKSQKYVMVKRETPLEPTDFTLEDRHDVGGKIASISERTGFDASFKNHDHDELLFNALHCSVEMKELM